MVKSYYRYIQKHTFGHSNTNQCLPEYRKSDGTLALGSKESVVFLNPQSGELKEKMIFEKKSSISSLKIKEDEFESYILVGFEDGDIHIKYYGDEEEVIQEKNTVFTEHTARVNCLQISKDGNMFVSGGDDNLIVLWDLVTQNPILKLKGHTAPVTCIDFFRLGNTDYVISGSKDGLIRIWDCSIKICVQVFQSGRNEVTCFEKLPGKDLSYAIGTDSEDIMFINVADFGKDEESGLRIYCKERGKFVREFYSKVDQIIFYQGFGFELLFLLSDRKQIEVLRLRNKKEVSKKFKRKKKRAGEQGKELEIEKNDFMSDIGNWLEPIKKIRVKGKIDSIFTVNKLKNIENLLYTFKSNNNFTVEKFSFEGENHTGELIISPYKDFLKLSHQSVIRATDISSDDSMCISCSNDSIKVWSTENSFQRIKHYSTQNVMSCRFLPKDRYVILGQKNGNILLLDLQSSEIVQEIDNAHTDIVWSIDIHPKPLGAEGIRIITGSADSILIFWELRKNEEGGIMLVEVQRIGTGEPIQWVKYSPNGTFYVAALLDNSIRMNYSDSNKLHLNFYGHKMPVLCVDISSDDALMVSGASDKYLKIWGTDFGDCHKSIFAHQAPITQVKFIKDTHYILSAGRDGTVRYWDGDSKEMIIELDAQQGDIWSLSVSSIGDFFIVGGADKILRGFVQTKDIVYTQFESRDREEKVLYLFKLFNRTSSKIISKIQRILMKLKLLHLVKEASKV